MNTVLLSLSSGLVGVIVGALIGHFSQRSLIRTQLAAADEAQGKLLKQMLEDRQLLNARLGQISSNTGNIAFWLKYPHQPEAER
jgi:hypothetical protein